MLRTRLSDVCWLLLLREDELDVVFGDEGGGRKDESEAFVCVVGRRASDLTLFSRLFPSFGGRENFTVCPARKKIDHIHFKRIT